MFNRVSMAPNQRPCAHAESRCAVWRVRIGRQEVIKHSVDLLPIIIVTPLAVPEAFFLGFASRHKGHDPTAQDRFRRIATPVTNLTPVTHRHVNILADGVACLAFFLVRYDGRLPANLPEHATYDGVSSFVNSGMPPVIDHRARSFPRPTTSGLCHANMRGVSIRYRCRVLPPKDNNQGHHMSYVVKWVAIGESNSREWPTTFRTPSEAIDLACSVLRQKPEDIWIEGPRGVRMDRDVIIRNCSARGLA